MDTLELLHLLRNPYWHSDMTIRMARIEAADLIERQAAEIERLRADAELYSQLRTWVEDRTKPSEESCIVISQDDFGAVVIEGKSIYAIGDSFSAAIDAARGEG